MKIFLNTTDMNNPKIEISGLKKTETKTKFAILIKETTIDKYQNKTFFSLYQENENFDLLQTGKKWELIEWAILNNVEITNLTK